MYMKLVVQPQLHKRYCTDGPAPIHTYCNVFTYMLLVAQSLPLPSLSLAFFAHETQDNFPVRCCKKTFQTCQPNIPDCYNLFLNFNTNEFTFLSLTVFIAKYNLNVIKKTFWQNSQKKCLHSVGFEPTHTIV